jgi:acetolactate synthase-1/2/3 large subunit
MVVITGQKPILDNRQGRYQLVDIPEMMRPVIKVSHTIPSAAALPGVVADAVHRALEFPQGPVHLELPADVAHDTSDEAGVLPMRPAPRPDAAPSTIDHAAELIGGAQRPLVLAGASANARLDVPPALQRFLDETGLPFFTTWMGKGAATERGDQYVGTATMPGMDFVGCAARHADLIVSVGHNVMEKAPFMMSPDGPQVIHVHDFPATADVIWFPQHQVVGNIASTLDGLTERLSGKEWNTESFTKIARAQQASIEMAGQDDSFPFHPGYVVARLREVLGEDDIVSVDNGIHKLWAARNYAAYRPRTTLIDSALGAMGPGLPAAIAAKMVSPGSRVVAITGDGGFMLNSQELETAVRLGLDLTTLVFNDAGLGMIRLKQQMDGYGTQGVDFANPDFVTYAASFGAHGHRPESAADLEKVLAATAEGGVHVVDLRINDGANGAAMMQMANIDCADVIG